MRDLPGGLGREQARQLPCTAAPPTGKAENDTRQSIHSSPCTPRTGVRSQGGWKRGKERGELVQWTGVLELINLGSFDFKFSEVR